MGKSIEFPSSALNCGGLIERIANYTYKQSFRPNAQLAFAGALSWVGHCMGRRYRTVSNGRPNMYILAVGWSGIGKSAPRKTNMLLAKECGLMDTVIDDFRSGEALEDTLMMNGRILSQYDEVNVLFSAIKTGRDIVANNTQGAILKLWEKSGSFHKRRKLANSVKCRSDDKTPDIVYHPHFSFFGTGVTSEVYKSISSQMASNGFFSRLLFIDCGKRGPEASPIFMKPPADIISDCKTLAGYTDNRDDWMANNPACEYTGDVVQTTEDATKVRNDLNEEAKAYYDDEQDGAGNALWNRTIEKAEKIALVLAGSDNPEHPVITAKNWEIAHDLIMYSHKKQIATLIDYAAENDYEDLQNRILRKLKKGRCCNRAMLASLRVKNEELREAVETLRDSGRLIFCNEKGEELHEWGRGISYSIC